LVRGIDILSHVALDPCRGGGIINEGAWRCHTKE
jgi:hypothetical protein